MKVRVAAVQDAPVFLDLEATADKVIAIIEEASHAGASVVGFPEGFLPGHAAWSYFMALDDRFLELNKKLFLNSAEANGPALQRIAAACATNGVGIVLGACERTPNTSGTLFNSQFFIDEHGTIAAKHQKYVATIGERLVHGPGTTPARDNFFRTHGMTVSGLICGENSNPLAQYATATSYPTLHVMSWPQHFDPAVDMWPVTELVAKGFAYSLRCFVMSCVSTISPEMIAVYGDAGGALDAYLASSRAPARSAIFGPDGSKIAEASDASPQLVYADLDPDDLIIPKFFHDTAGHYNRPEVFAPLFAPDAQRR